MSASQNCRIFISYSHRGQGPVWKAVLLEHLKLFTAQNRVDAWDDEKIPGGWRWEGEIEKAIHNAWHAVTLLTKEALESEFMLERELVPLSRREAGEGFTVIPILCEQCALGIHPWLKQVQVRPIEARPLSLLSEAQQQVELRKLAV